MMGAQGLALAAPRGWLWGAAAVAALGVLLGAWRWARGTAAGRRRRRPGRLQRVGTVSSLFVYPVKSCQGVAVQRARVTPMGLQSGEMRDRFWLVVKEDGHMVTARQEPRLVLITTGCENGYLTLSAQGMKKLCLPVKLPSKNPVQNCRVFGLDIQGRDCGDEVAQWITTFLNSEPYRLVHFEPSMVPRKSKDIINLFRTTDEVAYPDCSPLLIISEASLKDLNTRLEKKVKIQNFRPNIFVSDCGAFEEDNWEDILIGDVEMKGTVCCGRCILTTVDPDTGVLDRKEPLETLKSYRLCDPSERHIYKSSPLFGKYFAVDKTGTIQVGDPVYKMIE
ncbi:mitochondrial amidoxime-reducing component 1 [Gallus gallus]|uniref:Mitochondrial amidoxime reducing component 1 n=2 Tax=Phasianidae TaxID=9005 RepID=F1NXH1_CHICK|nr:mitochondrial amidoxime-reducing component 1 [Gallus gallus]|eukprot:NP_001269310.1 mitochondrial amidoxime-reducing component 1 [Gallus gallus]